MLAVSMSSCNDRQRVTKKTTYEEKAPASKSSAQPPKPKQFIEGGFVYVGKEVNPPNEYKDYTSTTEYSITLYKDGTATWKETTSYSNGEEGYSKNRDNDVKWEKRTVRKHDKVYTWYLITGKSYSDSRGWYDSEYGALDEQGRLYTLFVDDDSMVEKLDSGKYTCTVEKRKI